MHETLFQLVFLFGHEFKFGKSAGQVARGTAALGHAVQRVSRGAERSVDVGLVFKAELEAAFADHGRLDVHEFTVVGGLSVTNRKLQDRCCEPFGFHFGVAGAYGPEKFGAGLFKPYGVNGVVDDSHLVGFCITDIDPRGMLKCASFHGLNI